MSHKGANHPFVIWAACFLWLVSMFAISWSLLLFFCVGDMLLLTGTDLVNAVLLLSGILMIPTNVHMLYAIGSGAKIDHKAKVVCCPFWMCVFWVTVINAVGVILSIQRICFCHDKTVKAISNSMKHYRSVPKYKHFIDNIQWSLKCCGLNSYKDWFNRDWFDKIRDYEFDPSAKRKTHAANEMMETDSVPLSCCKSGSCISNYLKELGTYSIHTSGCGKVMHQIVMISMYTHLILFVIIIITEVLILRFVIKNNKLSKDIDKGKCGKEYNVSHIMSVNDKFDVSSGSCQLNPEDSDDDEETTAEDKAECFTP